MRNEKTTAYGKPLFEKWSLKELRKKAEKIGIANYKQMDRELLIKVLKIES